MTYKIKFSVAIKRLAITAVVICAIFAVASGLQVKAYSSQIKKPANNYYANIENVAAEAGF